MPFRIDFFADLAINDSMVPMSLNTICAQYISREDELWMRGLCPSMQSMAISVFCCHRNSNGVIYAVAGPVAPCVSFVVENDTTSSLLKRIAFYSNSDDDPQHDEILSKLLQFELVAIESDKKFIPLKNASVTGEDSSEVDRPWDAFSQCSMAFDSNKAWKSTSSMQALVELAIVLPESIVDGPR